MKIEIKDGKLQIDVEDLASSLSTEDLKRFSQHAVFQDSIVAAVLETIVSGGCFDDGWYISGFAEQLRKKLLPLVPVAMQELVKKLLQERDEAKANRVKVLEILHRAERHWPREVEANECTSTNPYYCHCPWKAEDVETFLAEQLGENWKAECTPAEVVQP